MSNDFILKENIINWINIAVKKKKSKIKWAQEKFSLLKQQNQVTFKDH